MGQQSLIYSFVARRTVVLAEFTRNFTSIASQCLQKLPSIEFIVVFQALVIRDQYHFLKRFNLQLNRSDLRLLVPLFARNRETELCQARWIGLRGLVMKLKEQLSEAEKEIQRLLERYDGVSSNSPASLFSMEAMDPPPFLGEFGMEGFGNIFYVPENNYNHDIDWVNLI